MLLKRIVYNRLEFYPLCNGHLEFDFRLSRSYLPIPDPRFSDSGWSLKVIIKPKSTIPRVILYLSRPLFWDFLYKKTTLCGSLIGSQWERFLCILYSVICSSDIRHHRGRRPGKPEPNSRILSRKMFPLK